MDQSPNQTRTPTFRPALRKVFTSFTYLRIKHPEKRWFDVKFPIIVSCPFAAIYCVTPMAVLGDGGLIRAVSPLLQILVGFFVASLAAVATFQRPGLDDEMAGEPKPKLRGKRWPMTRREFLCYTLGHLAASSLLLFLVGAIVQMFGPIAARLLPPLCAFAMKAVFVALYLFAFSHIMCVTSLSLYYLVDRIHRSDPD